MVVKKNSKHFYQCSNLVGGRDGNHHTFFEMLGNWAFRNAYGKKEACEMAWTFLTKVLKVPPDRLYVTYFGGSEAVPEADFETREIWLELGVHQDRVLPFGEAGMDTNPDFPVCFFLVRNHGIECKKAIQ